ncbi:hypothetical protein IVB02_09200 [Bradyrhizobium sp. 166]|uniref:hypothetical protein n=1 Tax=Bradyrhizobium sp. 166 TaxID=2782638 RepID=UPI001FF7061B|nr:hypothetical protein [Bradyrhizobium sp. 166]MCK1601606.1 hypothetical protein [Bradyrhizobium sp. 166]
MLSTVENFFVRLLRGTVIATAFVSFVVTLLALLYAAYAWCAPDPIPNVAGQTTRLRKATDPAELFKELFPPESSVVKETAAPDGIPYESGRRSDNDAFQEFNKFLDIALGGSFDNAVQFSSWLNGNNAVPFRWPTVIDNKAKLDDSNIELLSKSLLYDYAKRLAYRAPAVKAVSKVKPYSNALDALTAATPPSRAPYFLTWFFEKLQGELRVIAQEFQEERNQRIALRATTPFALSVAGGAFSYFIFIMFLFLLVSIEAGIRTLASVVPVGSLHKMSVHSHSPTIDDPPAPAGSQA